MQKSFVVQNEFSLSHADNFKCFVGDIFLYDAGNKNTLSVYRDEALVKVTDLSPTILAALERNKHVLDLQSVATKAKADAAEAAEAAAKAAAEAQRLADEAAKAVAQATEAQAQLQAKLKGESTPAPVQEQEPTPTTTDVASDDDDSFFDENSDAVGEDDDKDITPTTPDVQFHRMSKAAIIAHAAKAFPGLVLDPKASHKNLVAAVEAAQAAALAGSGSSETTTEPESTTEQ